MELFQNPNYKTLRSLCLLEIVVIEKTVINHGMSYWVLNNIWIITAMIVAMLSVWYYMI